MNSNRIDLVIGLITALSTFQGIPLYPNTKASLSLNMITPYTVNLFMKQNAEYVGREHFKANELTFN